MSKIYLNPNAIKENTIPIDKIVAVDLDGKQDIINDLETIRSGAAKGATALQSFAETDPIFSASPAASITNSDITNWNAKTSNTGTVTGIKMNGVSKGTSGVVDLGDVITSLEGYATENYVTNAITNAKIEGGDGDPIDLSGYATKDDLNKKVDKVTGKGLSTNDFTDELKQKLEGLDEDIKGNVQSDWNATSGDAQILNKPQLATVATTGSYNDLTNKPTIPSAVTESTVSGWGFTKNTGTYSKPTDGIPKSDLTSDVQTALEKATSAIQSSDLAKVATSGSYNDLKDKPNPPAIITESTVSGWGFTKNTGTYSKPTTGIPTSDLSEDVQTALGKANSAVQSDDLKDVYVRYSDEQIVAGNGMQDVEDNLFYLPEDNLPDGPHTLAIRSDLEGYVQKISPDDDGVNYATAHGFYDSDTGLMYCLPEFTTGNENYIIVTDDKLKTVNGQSIYGEGDITVGENKYVTDFTIFDLDQLLDDSNGTLNFDSESLINALQNQQRILVPIDNEISGFAILNGYVEDMLYASIIFNNSLYSIENYTEGVLNHGDIYVTDLYNPKTDFMINVTWQKLRSLRNNGNLIPGMQYRITDYETTTAQVWTKSAGHQFDIIVTADNENTLNENAKAIQHEGDEYFKDCNLAAWQIWYCLDNDTSRFNWISDETKTIELIKVEFEDGGKVNLSRLELLDTEVDEKFYYGWHYSVSSYGYFVYTETLDITSETIFYEHKQNKMRVKDILLCFEQETIYKGKGVIYRMIDEYKNDCPYDFKNIMFMRPFDDEGNLFIGESWSMSYEKNPKYLYTFTAFDDLTQEIMDASLIYTPAFIDTVVQKIEYNSVRENQILSDVSSELTNIVMCNTLGSISTYNNYFEESRDITFIESSSYNQIKSSHDINISNAWYNTIQSCGYLKNISTSLNRNVFTNCSKIVWNNDMKYTNIFDSDQIVNNIVFESGIIEHCYNLTLNPNGDVDRIRGNRVFYIENETIPFSSHYTLIVENNDTIDQIKISNLANHVTKEYVDTVISESITNVLNTEV